MQFDCAAALALFGMIGGNLAVPPRPWEQWQMTPTGSFSRLE